MDDPMSLFLRVFPKNPMGVGFLEKFRVFSGAQKSRSFGSIHLALLKDSPCWAPCWSRMEEILKESLRISYHFPGFARIP